MVIDMYLTIDEKVEYNIELVQKDVSLEDRIYTIDLTLIENVSEIFTVLEKYKDDNLWSCKSRQFTNCKDCPVIDMVYQDNYIEEFIHILTRNFNILLGSGVNIAPTDGSEIKSIGIVDTKALFVSDTINKLATKMLNVFKIPMELLKGNKKDGAEDVN